MIDEIELPHVLLVNFILAGELDAVHVQLHDLVTIEEIVAIVGRGRGIGGTLAADGGESGGAGLGALELVVVGAERGVGVEGGGE